MEGKKCRECLRIRPEQDFAKRANGEIMTGCKQCNEKRRRKKNNPPLPKILEVTCKECSKPTMVSRHSSHRYCEDCEAQRRKKLAEGRASVTHAQCTMCHVTKEAWQFHPCKNNKTTGLYNYCRDCNTVRTRENAKQRKSVDPSLYKLRVILDAIRQRQKKIFGTETDLTIDDLMPFHNIKYCPIIPSLEIDWKSKKKTKASPSIDRIIPEKGYVRGNIMFLSDLANTMKNNANLQELAEFGENIKWFAVCRFYSNQHLPLS